MSYTTHTGAHTRLLLPRPPSRPRRASLARAGVLRGLHYLRTLLTACTRLARWAFASGRAIIGRALQHGRPQSTQWRSQHKGDPTSSRGEVGRLHSSRHAEFFHSGPRAQHFHRVLQSRSRHSFCCSRQRGVDLLLAAGGQLARRRLRTRQPRPHMNIPTGYDSPLTICSSGVELLLDSPQVRSTLARIEPAWAGPPTGVGTTHTSLATVALCC